MSKKTSKAGSRKTGTPQGVPQQKGPTIKVTKPKDTEGRSPAADGGTAGGSARDAAVTVPNRLGLIVAALGVIGMGISAYLAYAHYRGVSTICLEGMECDEVLSSSYAQILGIPLSVLGLGMFLVVTVLGLLIWRGPGRLRGLFSLAAYAVALAATLWSLYLYYLEAFELGAFCTWCVLSSLVVFALLPVTVMSIVRGRRSEELYEGTVRSRSGLSEARS